MATKQAVQQAQILQVTDPGKPFELDVHVTAEGYNWGLWQHSELTQWIFGPKHGKAQRAGTP